MMRSRKKREREIVFVACFVGVRCTFAVFLLQGVGGIVVGGVAGGRRRRMKLNDEEV